MKFINKQLFINDTDIEIIRFSLNISNQSLKNIPDLEMIETFYFSLVKLKLSCNSIEKLGEQKLTNSIENLD